MTQPDQPGSDPGTERRWSLYELRDVARFADLSDSHAQAFGRLAANLIERGRSEREAAHALVVPGRIELLGKHTDYAGGRSLTCATEQGFCVIAMERPDRVVAIEDLGRAVAGELALDAALEPSATGWMRYVETVARRLSRDFGGGTTELRGADVAWTSDLPAAAGMSSSSALVVALVRALIAVNRLAERPEYRRVLAAPEELAGYLGAVENGGGFGPFEPDLGVGTFGGSEDHTAIVCSAAGRIGQYSYAPVRTERSIELPAGHVFVVAASGVRASKAGASREPFNRLTRSAAALASIWREATGRAETDLASILSNSTEAVGELREAVVSRKVNDFSSRELLDRLEHFRVESERLVPEGGDALENGDPTIFGLIADRSQYLAERLLGNQIAETTALAEGARELGAVAASAFGAGFGGAVWALVPETEADALAESWLAQYLEAFPEHGDDALALITTAAPPCRELGG